MTQLTLVGQPRGDRGQLGFGHRRKLRMRRHPLHFAASSALALAMLTGVMPGAAFAHARDQPTRGPQRFIIESDSTENAKNEVRRIGARSERELPIIHAVLARLNSAQARRLSAKAHVRVYANSRSSSAPT